MARFLSPEQVAEALGLSRRTIYRMLSSGEIPSVKIRRSRRIRASVLDALGPQVPGTDSSQRH